MRSGADAQRTGTPLAGTAVGELIAWAEGLDCGIDRMTDRHCAVPA
jgi:hypothetical protein